MQPHKLKTTAVNSPAKRRCFKSTRLVMRARTVDEGAATVKGRMVLE